MVERFTHENLTLTPHRLTLDSRGSGRTLQGLVLEPSGTHIEDAPRIGLVTNKIASTNLDPCMLQLTTAYADEAGIPVVALDVPSSGLSDSMTVMEHGWAALNGPRRVVPGILQALSRDFQLADPARRLTLTASSRGVQWTAAFGAAAHQAGMVVERFNSGDGTSMVNRYLLPSLAGYYAEKKFHPERHQEAVPSDELIALADRMLQGRQVGGDVTAAAVYGAVRGTVQRDVYEMLITQDAVDMLIVVPEYSLGLPGRFSEQVPQDISQDIDELKEFGMRHRLHILRTPGGHAMGSKPETWRQMAGPLLRLV